MSSITHKNSWISQKKDFSKFKKPHSLAAPYLRDRPRGLGLLQLPTGMSDERSGPIFPGLYIAGNKVNEKPQTVPDVHLPGQPAVFSGR